MPVAAPTKPHELPPPFTLVSLRESGDAFGHACRIAASGGAGTLVRVGRYDLVEFAVVLEPEEPLAAARRAFFAGMTALADAIARGAPPQKPLAFDWAGGLRLDGARIGGGRLGWPDGAGESTVPDWLVFGAMVRVARIGMGDPGDTPDATSLHDEGFEEDSADLLGGFARSLMAAFHEWSEQGFDAVAARYLDRLPAKAGTERRIDEGGDLLLRRHGQAAPERLPLVPELVSPSWLDPASGRPRL